MTPPRGHDARRKPIDPNLHLRIELAFLRSGKSQSELAQELDVTPGAINHYIRGRHEPGRKMMVRLATILGVSLEWLSGQLPEQGNRVLEALILSLMIAGGPELEEQLKRLTPQEAVARLMEAPRPSDPDPTR